MKKKIIIVLISFISSISFGQDKKVDEVLNKWKDCFNKQDYKSAYDLYTLGYRQKVSEESVTKQMKEVYNMMGKLKSVKFVSYKDYVYKYIFYSKANHIEGDVSIVVSKDYQLGYLSFDRIGGTGDAPPMAN
ncbi:hypothetical protein EZ428_11370 [Pedobacter frigiditerrae]|uniref:DUF3887 domain-containing protein n=1 Tax=Pedobacter frigiditerrae TaxID=2530452 RepID=A0A4R0MYD0_9SPHI|nr:hypothetical protein [Pedobacter frigiditerrae]TCC92318.1 hypothetical protein EZ428_11370 [Pedobacter frigiditerrae]